ncbi:uncharacterized protein [Penaeus vannamei]|uniref:uncharacterized protein n=1 Tax=Penaeus vannamei TaxID=6689 RepID=UPI00387F57A0
MHDSAHIYITVGLQESGKNDKQRSNKLSVETKELVQKRRAMKVSSNRDKIELAELTKTIKKKKREDVRKFNTQIINKAVISGTSMEAAKRRLGIGRYQMYAIKKPDGEVTHNKNEIIKVVEDFYRDLYNSNEHPQVEANAHLPSDCPELDLPKARVHSSLPSCAKGP